MGLKLKTPQEFQVGDVLTKTPGAPNSGSPITKVEGMGDNQTQVSFANGLIVEFYNGYQHEIQE